MLTIGELFAGYGGLGMGVKAALGGEVRWVSDIDKGACKILAHRFPDVPNLGDITALDWSDVEPVDILTGGFPCQDVSHAGRRAGLIRGETRTGLWAEMLRGIATMRPRLVVAENVRGLLSARADSDVEPCPWCLGDADDEPPMRALGAVLADLADIGYDAAWCGLRAADVGAAHGRFRVFILAWPATNSDGRLDVASESRADQRSIQTGDGRGASAALLPTPSCSDTNGAGQHGDGGLDLRTAVAGLLPTPTARDGKDGQIRREPHRPDDTDTLARALTDVPCALLPTPAVNDMGEGKTVERWDEWTDDMKAKHGNGNGHGKSLAIEAQRLLPTPTAVTRDRGEEEIAHRRATRNKGLNLDEIRSTEWGDYAAAIARWEAVLGRPAPAPTMTSAKGNPQLSPAFTEWLMGLPAGWITDVPGITRNEALKACGNGVVPQQCAAAVRWLWQYVPASVRASLMEVAA